MAEYVVSQRLVVRSGSLDGSRPPEYAWRQLTLFGSFASKQEAKAAFWRVMEPDLARADDAYCALHFDRFARDVGSYRVEKVAEVAA